MDHSDAVLLMQWTSRRDSDAFMELVIRHSGMVYSTCLRVLGNPADAEEVTQECFLELSQAASKVRKTCAGWLHSVAVKRAVTRIRSDVRRRAREQAYAEDLSVKREPDWEDIRPHLDACIAELPDSLRSVIVSRFLEGLTHEDASQRLGVPVSTMQYRIQKGLEQLRELLAKRGIVSSASVLAAILGATAAEGMQVSVGLTASLGKLVLSKGATGTGSVAAAAGGGILAMKYAFGAVALVAVLAGLSIAAKRYVAKSEEEAQVTVAQPSDSSEPSSSASVMSSEDATMNSRAPAPLKTEPGAAQETQEVVSQASETIPSGNVSGVVVRAKTGEPMPGLVFSLRKYEGNSPYGGFKNIGEVKTDAEGRFAFEAQDVTTYWLILEHDSLALYESYTGSLITLKKPGQVINEVVLKVGPGASISGRVYDMATGQGIKGVEVITYGGRRSVETDENGRYRLAGLQQVMGAYNDITLANTGSYVNLYVHGMGGHGVELEPGQRLENVDFPLEKGIELKGIVVNKAGERFFGGEVYLEGSFEWQGEHKNVDVQTEICEDGRFVLAGVKPDMKYGDLYVSGTGTASDPEGRAYWSHREYGDVEVWTGERRFVLQEAAYVRGKVLDAQTGQPITAFELLTVEGKLTHMEMGWRGSFKPVEDPEGRFTCTGRQGFTTVFVRAEGYALGVVHVETSKSGETVETEVRLEPGGVIEGTVTNWRGEPVQGACIIDGLPPKGDRYAKEEVALVRSDNRGQFRAIIKPGDRMFSAWDEALGTVQVQTSVAVGQTVTVNFVLGTGGRIRGRVTQNGGPVPVPVWVEYTILGEQGVLENGHTDTQEEYAMAGLPTGRGTVLFSLNSPSRGHQAVLVPVETAEGRETVVDYDFPAATGIIQGTVRLNGLPMQRGGVLAYAPGSVGALSTAYGQMDGGAYVIKSVPEGEVVLAARINTGTQIVVHREVVVVKPGAVIQRDIDITTGGGTTVQGRVILHPNLVRREPEIGLLQGSPEMADRVHEEYYMITALVTETDADAEGRYRLEGIPDGDYTLVAKVMTVSQETQYALNHVRIRNGEPQTVNLEMR